MEPDEVRTGRQRSSHTRYRIDQMARMIASRYVPVGIAVAVCFAALSMTPSLLPRAALTQGLMTGITMAAGYAAGVAVHWLWRYLELPSATGPRRRFAWWIVTALLAAMLAYSMFNLVRWQNDLRRLFGMDEVNDPVYPVIVVIVGLVVAVALIGVARLIVRGVRASARWMGRLIPCRVGRVLGGALAVVMLMSLVSGVLVRGAVDLANRSFSIQNGRVDQSLAVPTSTLRSGGPGSLISWDSLGSPGRTWIARGPTAEEIEEFSGGGALEPIRAYVGVDSAGSVEDRAELLLAELIRMGAFDREVLVLATSTGSGGIDPRGTSSVEYVHNGDTAIAGIQYSFLPSALSFFVDQNAALEASTTMFETIHSYWRELDEATRPELYLFGVSLGSYGSEASSASIRIAGDPIDGAVWAGPTFNNDQWVAITGNRDEGSPAWLPVYDDGLVVRFTSNEDPLAEPDGVWLEDRYVYIEHGSDPVSFFSPDLLWSEPAWLRGERSPQVSKHMNWYPIITFWQVAFDLPMGGSVPRGFGHNFGIPAYVDAWVAVTEPAGWADADSARLVEFLEARDES